MESGRKHQASSTVPPSGIAAYWGIYAVPSASNLRDGNAVSLQVDAAGHRFQSSACFVSMPSASIRQSLYSSRKIIPLGYTQLVLPSRNLSCSDTGPDRKEMDNNRHVHRLNYFNQEQWDEFSLFFSPVFHSGWHDTLMKLTQKRNLSLEHQPTVARHRAPPLTGGVCSFRLYVTMHQAYQVTLVYNGCDNSQVLDIGPSPFFLALWANISRTLMPRHKPALHCRRTPAARLPLSVPAQSTTTQTNTTSPTTTHLW
ncbi:hypothetical protein Pelo_8173 [Pelomyxa schiedti]|nr:hypothetical protein Pelo_8173 [Pelomyxa schiedti]